MNAFVESLAGDMVIMRLFIILACVAILCGAVAYLAGRRASPVPLDPDDIVPRGCIAVDLETGGLDPSRHPVLAVGIRTIHRDVNASFEIHVMPREGMELDSEALAVNGYSPDEWHRRGAVDETEAFERMRAWFADMEALHPGIEWCPVAHNVGHDRRFFEAWEARWREDTGFQGAPLLPRRWRCTQAVAGFLADAGLLRTKNSGLDAVCIALGILDQPRPPIHSALSDAIYTRAVYRGLIALLAR